MPPNLSRLRIFTSGYTTEILCDAILGSPAGKIEAARIYGITGFEILPSNVTPLAFPMALPA